MDGRRPPPEMSNFYCLPGRAGGTPICIRWNTEPPRLGQRALMWNGERTVVGDYCEAAAAVERPNGQCRIPVEIMRAQCPTVYIPVRAIDEIFYFRNKIDFQRAS